MLQHVPARFTLKPPPCLFQASSSTVDEERVEMHWAVTAANGISISIGGKGSGNGNGTAPGLASLYDQQAHLSEICQPPTPEVEQAHTAPQRIPQPVGGHVAVKGEEHVRVEIRAAVYGEEWLGEGQAGVCKGEVHMGAEGQVAVKGEEHVGA